MIANFEETAECKGNSIKASVAKRTRPGNVPVSQAATTLIGGAVVIVADQFFDGRPSCRK